jgi:hypothetical protein
MTTFFIDYSGWKFCPQIKYLQQVLSIFWAFRGKKADDQNPQR